MSNAFALFSVLLIVLALPVGALAGYSTLRFLAFLFEWRVKQIITGKKFP